MGYVKFHREAKSEHSLRRKHVHPVGRVEKTEASVRKVEEEFWVVKHRCTYPK